MRQNRQILDEVTSLLLDSKLKDQRTLRIKKSRRRRSNLR